MRFVGLKMINDLNVARLTHQGHEGSVCDDIPEWFIVITQDVGKIHYDLSPPGRYVN